MGSIDTGHLADMVLLSKDPTVDIKNTKSIVFVMKNGQIIDESRLPLAGGKQKRRFRGGRRVAASPAAFPTFPPRSARVLAPAPSTRSAVGGPTTRRLWL